MTIAYEGLKVKGRSTVGATSSEGISSCMLQWYWNADINRENCEIQQWLGGERMRFPAAYLLALNFSWCLTEWYRRKDPRENAFRSTVFQTGIVTAS